MPLRQNRYGFIGQRYEMNGLKFERFKRSVVGIRCFYYSNSFREATAANAAYLNELPTFTNMKCSNIIYIQIIRCNLYLLICINVRAHARSPLTRNEFIEFIEFIQQQRQQQTEYNHNKKNV